MGGKKMDSWFLIPGWSSPIGVGIFLICLGGMIYLLSKADAESKHARREGKEKKVAILFKPGNSVKFKALRYFNEGLLYLFFNLA